MAIDKRISKTGKIAYRARLRFTGGGEMSSTHERLTDARDWEAQARTQLKSGAVEGAVEAQRHTAAAAIDRYLELLPSFKLKDERNRRRHVEWWRRELGDLPLSAVTAKRIAQARDRLQTIPIARDPTQPAGVRRLRGPATVVRYLAALSYIFTLAVDDWGWCDDNPVRKVRKPKQPRGRVRYLSDVERVRLLAACRASSSRALYPVVVIAIATGMRKGEILRLRWSQVDLDAGLVMLYHTKNGEPRQLPLVGHAVEVLRYWAKAPHTEHDYVFPGETPDEPRDITKAWTTAAARAELTDFRFHDLRHTTASYLARRGASILEIGEVLGHKSPQSTRRYSHLSVAHTRTLLSGMVAEAFPTDLPQMAPGAEAA